MRDLPWVLTCGANTAGEHEVEQFGFGHFVVRVRIGDLVLPHELAQLWT